MLNTTLPPWPAFTDEEAAAVSRVLLSGRVNYWTGEEGRSFEAEFATWCGADYAIAVSNGTVALDLALHGLGVGAQNGGHATDEVVVTPRTFLASASTVVNAGAVPVFADVDRNSGNITAATIAKVLTPNTRAIIAVHLAGWPCDMDPIMELARERNIRVIEDCAQAHGARYRGRPVGALADVAAWSFCQDKIMTTGGEGGMVTTNDEGLHRRMWAMKDHGKSWEAVYERDHPPGFRWLHESFGTNWRLTEMQSAIGRIQLARMQDWTAARETNAAALAEAIAPFAGEAGPVRLPRFVCTGCTGCDANTGCRHAQYKFYVYVRPENLKPDWSRDRIASELTARGTPAFQGSCSEVYLERAFDGTGWRPEPRLPVAHELGETSLMLLVHPTIRPDDRVRMGTALAEVLAEAAN